MKMLKVPSYDLIFAVIWLFLPGFWAGYLRRGRRRWRRRFWTAANVNKRWQGKARERGGNWGRWQGRINVRNECPATNDGWRWLRGCVQERPPSLSVFTIFIFLRNSPLDQACNGVAQLLRDMLREIAFRNVDTVVCCTVLLYSTVLAKDARQVRLYGMKLCTAPIKYFCFVC